MCTRGRSCFSTGWKSGSLKGFLEHSGTLPRHRCFLLVCKIPERAESRLGVYFCFSGSLQKPLSRGDIFHFSYDPIPYPNIVRSPQERSPSWASSPSGEQSPSGASPALTPLVKGINHLKIVQMLETRSHLLCSVKT